MKKAGPKYMQLKKRKYLQEKAFEIYTYFWKQCFFRCHNAKGVKLLTILKLGLSHFREHKFKFFIFTDPNL